MYEMVSLIGYKMVQENKHFPEEIYMEIMSYLIPKYLLNIPEIHNYNKVVDTIPRFESVCNCVHGIGDCPEKFGYVTTTDYTIRYFYHLNYTTSAASRRKRSSLPNPPPYIQVYLPFLLNQNHEKQYDDYIQSNQCKKRKKRDLHKAIYG